MQLPSRRNWRGCVISAAFKRAFWRLYCTIVSLFDSVLSARFQTPANTTKFTPVVLQSQSAAFWSSPKPFGKC